MMRTPRRSSRLRGSSVTPGKSMNYTPNHLGSLTERDETPTCDAQSNFDHVVSSPLVPRTPATAGRLKPSREEMHPSKAQHSTTKQPDSGLRLGFTDIEAGGNQPSGLNQHTPSKTPRSNSTFDFRFARPIPQLRPEAQQVMNDLHEDALRIKARMAAEREESVRNGTGELAGVGGRKIAQPKGKVGRYSDVHMAEFKKMDSIAGHPSAFRAQSGRPTPIKATLKRTQSKAKLDDREDMKSVPSSAKVMSTERLENDSPFKRARKNVANDISSTRPVSRDNMIQPSTPSTPRSHTKMLSSLTTPTQASLSRITTVKTHATQIPSLSRSPSKPNLTVTPRGLTKSTSINNLSDFPRSESKPFLPSPGKIGRIKSMLRYPSLGAKKPSAIPSSIPSFAMSSSKPDSDKVLTPVPTTPGGLSRPKIVKHVSFTPETVEKHVLAAHNSPSPMKSGIPRSASKVMFSVNAFSGIKPSAVTTKPAEINYPSLSNHPSLNEKPNDIEYPSLSSVRPLPDPPRQAVPKPQLPPSVPGTFTFRSDHTINFGQSPSGFGSSPGQSSLRQVRPSIFPNIMRCTFPTSGKENNDPLPSVPHGMSNKKRRRVNSDNEKEDDVERSPKKRKAEAAEGPMPMASPSKNSSSAKKKGLSLSRLNMLARPKMRK